MVGRPWSVWRIPFLVVVSLLALSLSAVFLPHAFSAPLDPSPPETPRKAKAPPLSLGEPGQGPLEITADRIEYLKGTAVYEARGSVVVVQGPLRLTADQVTLLTLSGTLIATGHAHLKDPGSDLWADRLELDVNTEAGVVTNGQLFIKETNTLVTGRLLQRFSEDHFRAKDGSFTNCDAQDGKVPPWRFTFKDLDVDTGDRFYGKNLWLCVNDAPIFPIPILYFPLGATRKTGLLVPTIGYDNRFGFHYRQGFFWAINPSQDVTITPDYLSDRGYGGDLEYRYVLDRKSKGQWLVSYIHDTEVNRDRAIITGSHVQRVNPTLSIRGKANFLTDRTILQNLSNSGTLRALPSQESHLNINQKVPYGNLYLEGQFLQPVGVGGKSTFQRLPEIGYRVLDVSPFSSPLFFGLDATFVNFAREEGFTLNRADVMPSLRTEMLNVGHVVGFTPEVRLRETYYTRGVANEQPATRETFWASLSATSRLARRFGQDSGGGMLHSLEPYVIYEYVPPTDQSDIVVVDAVDDLPKKNLLTYSLRSRLLEQGSQGVVKNWLDVTVAQSFHPGSVQARARQFPFPGTQQFTTVTQPLQPATVPVEGKKFSDIWTRAVIGNTVGPRTGVVPLSLTVDTFFDPYRGEFSQVNSDLRYQDDNIWYLEVGQRFTRSGNRVRRGDIWNPVSFGEVFAPTPELQFVQATGAVKLPYGWTVGARTYYDVKNGNSPETDYVALYQNPCRCWSLGLFFLQFPDRQQYNFMISLTGLGGTESFGTQVLRAILGPLLQGERGLPWSSKPTRALEPTDNAMGTSLGTSGR